jgi:hypothetical protein
MTIVGEMGAIVYYFFLLNKDKEVVAGIGGLK